MTRDGAYDGIYGMEHGRGRAIGWARTRDGTENDGNEWDGSEGGGVGGAVVV